MHGSWNTRNQFKGEKQFIIIRQCDKTWRQEKYNYRNLKKIVFGAIELTILALVFSLGSMLLILIELKIN